MEYASKTMLLYGLVFFLTFYGMNIHKLIKTKINDKSVLFSNISGGLIMGIVQIILVIVIKLAGQQTFPDGRFLVVGYTTFFIGPLAGIILVFISSFSTFVINGTMLSSLLITHLINLFLYQLGSSYIKSKGRNPRYYEIIPFVMITLAISISLAAFIASDNSAYLIALSNLPQVLFLASMLVCALFYVNVREIERVEFVKDLEQNHNTLILQNSEIDILYKEVSEKEDILRKSYEELTSYKERIEFLAYHESQTGFYNREKLYERLRLHKAQVLEPLGVLIIVGIRDSDKLETTLGNVLADTLYYLVGIEIMSTFEKISDNQVYSVGAGRFAILVDKKRNEEEVDSTYQQLQERFEESFVINTIEIKVHIIAGAIAFTENDYKPEDWMERCEFALFSAGSKAVNTQIVWFGDDLRERQNYEIEIEKGLYNAIEKNELYLVYQPQYDNDKKLCGAEALLRWKHPRLGEIPPSVFIPFAEKNGLIDRIGKAVGSYACQFIIRNREILNVTEKQIPISINASFLELINPNFAERFSDMLDKYQILSGEISIEVTETEVSTHYNELIENLKKLNQYGVVIELDDFGTGYSSLNHLGIMPVQTIKIDKSFIDRILEDVKIGELVELIIDFTHRFRMKVIAEGVETKEQFLWLKKRKCDKYQGFYFSKPLKEEHFIMQVNEKYDLSTER